MSSKGNVNEADLYPVESIPNSLSTLASAEMYRRLVLHDIMEENVSLPVKCSSNFYHFQYQFPDMTIEDHLEILYGSEETIFNGQKWGGMTSDPGIYLQAALEDEIEDDWSWSSNWRIFSKLGAGYSSLRYRGEILTNSYGCLPDVDGGLEFTLAIRTSVPLGMI